MPTRHRYSRLSLYFFILMISLFLEGCFMHSFDKNGTYPLQLDIKTVLEDKRVMFKITERHIELKDYYLKNINVNTSNSACNEKYEKGLVIWSYKPNLPYERISVLSKIIYNDKGEKATLRKNTLYTVRIQIQKVKDNKLGRGGIGESVFVLKNNGDILYGIFS